MSEFDFCCPCARVQRGTCGCACHKSEKEKRIAELERELGEAKKENEKLHKKMKSIREYHDGVEQEFPDRNLRAQFPRSIKWLLQACANPEA